MSRFSCFLIWSKHLTQLASRPSYIPWYDGSLCPPLYYQSDAYGEAVLQIAQ